MKQIYILQGLQADQIHLQALFSWEADRIT